MQKLDVLRNPEYPFNVSTTVMLGYGFDQIRFIIIDDNVNYVDGIFYFEMDDCERMAEFAQKLKDANLSALITDFDNIDENTNYIMLRKYRTKKD